MSARTVGSRGFTLMELLIAVAVFAVLSALAYGGLSNVLSTTARTEQRSQRLKNLQLAIRYMERDVAQILQRPVRDQQGDPEPAVMSATQPLLRLTRSGWPNPAGQTRSTLQRVAYDWQDEQLLRITSTVLDGIREEQRVKTALLNDVEDFQLRYLDDAGEWQTAWPPLTTEAGQAPPLPRAIEVTLSIPLWGELTRIMVVPQ